MLSRLDSLFIIYNIDNMVNAPGFVGKVDWIDCLQ